MRIGKLDNDTLNELILSKLVRCRSECLSAPAIGADCARVALREGVAVLSCDPITAGGKLLGYLTVHVNCNDAVAAGAEPLGLLVTMLVPPSATEEQVSRLADDIAAAALDANVDIVGGHTEVTDAVTRIVTSATVIAAPISRNLPIERGHVCEGDDIVMTKTAGIEGTLILASQHKRAAAALNDEELETALSMAKELSITKEGVLAAKLGAHAMHDVTEGGVFGALHELGICSDIEITVNEKAIPVAPVTKKLCKLLNIDVLRLISSGSLLISCANGNEMVDELNNVGIEATIIAKAGKHGFSAKLTDGTELLPPAADELYAALNNQ